MANSASKRGGAELLSTCAEAREIAALLERGQSLQPISEALDWLATGGPVKPLRLSLLPLDVSAREAALEWLCGANSAALSILDKQAAIIRCGSLGAPVAVPQPHRHRTPVVAARRSKLEQVDLFVAMSGNAIAQSDELLAEFVASGDVLVIAWSRTPSSIEPEQLALLSSLLDEFLVVCSVTVGDAGPATVLEQAGNADSATLDFLRRVKNHRGVAWAVNLPATPGETSDELLPRTNDALRGAVQDFGRARLLKLAVEMLASNLARTISLRAREQDELDHRASALAAQKAAAKKRPFGDIRYSIGRRLELLQAEITTENDRSTQPLGRLNQIMQEIVAELDLASLDVAVNHNVVSYSVNSAHFARINRRVLEELKGDQESDVAKVNATCRQIVDDAQQSLAQVDPGAPPLRWEEFNGDPIWYAVRNQIQIGKDVQINIPRRGIIDLITAGRQKVFILIMLTGLAGRMGVSKDVLAPLGMESISGALSAGFTLVALTVFFAAMFDSIVRWRKETAFQSEKELQKAKETLLSDGLRIVDAVQKAKSAGVKEFTKELARRLDKQIEEAESDLAARSQQAVDRLKEELAITSKRIDADRKQMDDVRKSLEKISATAAAVYGSADAALAAAIAQTRLGPAAGLTSPGLAAPGTHKTARPAIDGTTANRHARISSRLPHLGGAPIAGEASNAGAKARTARQGRSLGPNQSASDKQGERERKKADRLAEKNRAKAEREAEHKRVKQQLEVEKKRKIAEREAKKQIRGKQPEGKSPVVDGKQRLTLAERRAARLAGKQPGAPSAGTAMPAAEQKLSFAEKLAARKAAKSGGATLKSRPSPTAAAKSADDKSLVMRVDKKSGPSAGPKLSFAEKLAARRAENSDKSAEKKSTTGPKRSFAEKVAARRGEMAAKSKEEKPAANVGSPVEKISATVAPGISKPTGNTNLASAKPSFVETLAARRAETTAKSARQTPAVGSKQAEGKPAAATKTASKAGAEPKPAAGPKLSLAEKLAARRAEKTETATQNKATTGATSTADVAPDSETKTASKSSGAAKSAESVKLTFAEKLAARRAAKIASETKAGTAVPSPKNPEPTTSTPT